MNDEPAGRPTLRVISGRATPEEIAAVLAVVAVRGRAAAAPAEPAGASVWAAPENAHRAVHPRPAAGPQRWRTSYWPR